ncbi:MAG: hypothetical protein KDC37_03815 [Flavobacteriales bacterium]|nr:hypothetical protein [Flavobacteriales bacterium]
MSIGEILTGGDHAKALSHVRNLIRIAIADGNVDDTEYRLLVKIARHKGVDEEEVKKIIANVNDFEFIPPSSMDERNLQLWHLGRMVLADGVVEDEEIAKMSRYSVGLGYKAEIIKPLVETVLKVVEEELDEDDALAAIRKFLIKNQ